MGKVKNSGRFELKSRATLIDALAMAGGFAEFAKRDHILIKRRDGTTAVFNYDKFAEDAGAGNIDLQPDDIIIVP
jgi:polysaccharide export outer membrane protein